MSRRARTWNPGSNPWVVGVDPSLTQSGVVVAPPDWSPGDWGALRWTSYGEPAPDKELPPPDFERARIERMARIAERLAEFVFLTVGDGAAPVRAWVEGYAHNMAGGANAASLREFGGILRHWFLLRLRLPLVPVDESSARKLLLGKCPRRDRKTITSAALKSAGAPFENDDVCDAFSVMNWGISEVGRVAVCLAA